MIDRAHDRPQGPGQSVLVGLDRFEWSMEDTVAFEGALDTIGMVIACYSERIAEERRRPVPDDAAIERWAQARAETSAARRSLRPADRAEVDRTRHRYGRLYRELTASTESAGG
ncbi:MAG: hypothetical protein ACRC35_14655 [Angustibacter sp.]